MLRKNQAVEAVRHLVGKVEHRVHTGQGLLPLPSPLVWVAPLPPTLPHDFSWGVYFCSP